MTPTGLEILGFPANDFNQEQENEQSIFNLVRDKYGAKWPMFEKMTVNSDKCHPVFKWLRTNSTLYNKDTKLADSIPWSWSKFLIDKNGRVVKYWPSIV